MNKYILVATLALGVGVLGSLVFLSQDKGNPTAEIPVTQKTAQKNVVQEEEYIIDPSDMYSVDNSSQDTPLTELTTEESDWLIQMREEEKLARDVYLTLGDKWGLRIFTNIASSEQTHTDSIKTLIDRYGLADPVTDDTVGVFSLAEMQELYDDLVAKGSKSTSDALSVGALIEDLDIYDLDVAMAGTDESDIKTVYANLQKGSRNHMRAFVRNIERQGGAYVPEYISEEDYQSIISSSQERGRI
ncbi:DUF2202 domain-containing protein [Candidatus Kaiserbacteria bacterium]|nr:DUF2202 domain-containing protein [Candidatus Kaiserbacteria bacterium]USN92194.1 MAG: DUF2202 domain-containing protein [Candidatus Nomurabacteria bacterium]